MNINKVLLFGNLTRDPELRALPSGMNVASFSIATNRTYVDKDGKKQEEVDFHNIVVFGRQADTTAQYLKKGSSAFIEGRMQTRSWDDKKSGEKKYRTEVVAERVQFGPRKQGDAAPEKSQADKDWDAMGGNEDTPKAAPKKGPTYEGDVDVSPDDIPF